MSFSQPISKDKVYNYIYYYPQVLDSVACDNIVNHYNKDTFNEWQASTFSTATKNLGTSKVAMKEFWITPQHQDY